MRGPNLRALHEEARPGRCWVCDGRLPPQHLVACAEEECRRVYLRAYAADAYLRKRANSEVWARLLEMQRKNGRKQYQRLKANPEALARRRAQQREWAHAHPRPKRPGSHARRAA